MLGMAFFVNNNTNLVIWKRGTEMESEIPILRTKKFTDKICKTLVRCTHSVILYKRREFTDNLEPPYNIMSFVPLI